ncbi:MAG: tetratricopeptide repeat protein [Candidatus Neomarinimicrobiota bacterium]
MIDRINQPAGPVCITGMHRSGTSMVARILNLCGLYLGPEDQLMPPDEGNPTGYWQYPHIDRLTEDILAHFAAGWDFLLPPMPPNWELDPALTPYRKKARQLIRTMARQQPWGWKDPRCSLTLPFWKSLLPGLKVIVCLRNPVETARSLTQHTGSTDAFSYNLWLRYYQRILADTDPDDRLITHYDVYFIDPRSELQRVLRWLDWSVPEARAAAACQAISAPTRQQHLMETDLEAVRVPLEVVEAYEALCNLSGQVLQRALSQGLVPRITSKQAVGYRLPAADTTPPEMKKEARAAFDQAYTLIERRKYGKALKAMQQAVSLHPFHAQAQNDLGVLYRNDGDKEQALAHLGVARKLDPDNADTAKNLAELYNELGRTEDAIQTYLNIIDRRPQDVEALYWLATACASQGQKEQAFRLFSRVLELEPDHAGAKKGLALLQ